jgi:outer membrane receptor protein involved in Fe transport
LGTNYVNSRTPFVFGAVYAVLDWSVTRWFRLDAGARVDLYQQFGAIPVPRAAAIFRPVPGGVLKIMGGRAFRIPSAYEQYYTDGGVTQLPSLAHCPQNNPTTLCPESIWQAEIEYSQRFLEDWVALASVWGGYIENIIETDHVVGMPALIQYRNNTNPVVNAGVDVELRREFRQGWMLTIMGGYQRAQYVLSNQSWEAGWLANAPEWLASLRAVVPIVQTVANGALRISAETGRRISVDNPAVTSPSVVVDTVVSGYVARFGVRYAVGVYNLLDWRYEYPVTPSFASPTMPQNGRTFRVDLTANF